MKLLKIGELAKSAGVTVRTLHHYDEIGLLKPTADRESGHRLYNQSDVERLQQIASLKSIGLSLAQIEICLKEETYNLLETLVMQDAAIRARIEEQEKVQTLVRIMIDRLKLDQAFTTKEILLFINEVQKMEKIYTPEQIAKLQKRYKDYPDKVSEVEKAWPVLFKKFEEAMHAGLPVTDLKVQVLASEAQHYIDLFTGSDKEIEAKMDKNMEEQKENALKMWGVSKEVFEYASKAREQLKSLQMKQKKSL